MRIFEPIEKLQKINLLIESENTGTSFQFAKKLGISRSHLFNYFDELKNLGIEIKYDKKIGSYQYKNELKVVIEHPVKVLTVK